MNIPSLFCAVSLIFVPASFGADSFSATLKKLPAESGKSSFVSNWIPLELKEADMQEKYIDSTRVTDVGKAQMQFYFPGRVAFPGQTTGPVHLSGRRLRPHGH